ncbi:hypothetical protein M422DRAFT_775987 [Sphaerobolus stellatus SS14]|nr:hypothetical protein M422DRAFT_775987 [Sphaerobolus stellatus SS14]
MVLFKEEYIQHIMMRCEENPGGLPSSQAQDPFAHCTELRIQGNVIIPGIVLGFIAHGIAFLYLLFCSRILRSLHPPIENRNSLDCVWLLWFLGLNLFVTCGILGAIFLRMSYDRDVQPAAQMSLWVAVAMALWITVVCLWEFLEVTTCNDHEGVESQAGMEDIESQKAATETVEVVKMEGAA